MRNEISESIELATILVTDLVGSTRLATSVGPARADELRDEHFAVLREAIGASAGGSSGTPVTGLMVAFSSASAAVRCAVSMQQLLERRYRRAEQTLQVRIGMGAGASTVQHGEYFGMPSIEAARLCDKAPADGILVSPAARMLAGRLDGIRLDSAGALELKGFPEPIEAFAVQWTRLAEEAGVGGWPLPALLRSTPRAAFVGRDAERAVMERSRSQARAGAPQVVLVSGEPGIGKSRLASLSAHGAHGEGFAVLWGACSEELAVPYEPWISVLAAGGARTLGGARAARRASRRRACTSGARAAPTVARRTTAGKLRSGDRTLPALLGRLRGAHGVGGVGPCLPRARRSALG